MIVTLNLVSNGGQQPLAVLLRRGNVLLERRLGEGMIDMKAFLGALTRIGYDGPVAVQVALHD